MLADVKALIELQQVDQSVAALVQKIDDCPGQIKALQDQLTEFIGHLGERKERLGQNQKERRELDGEVQTIKARIDRHKDQLYQVKTNDQYRAMLKEIEGEEEKIRKAEDRILEKMLEAEQIEKLIRDATARLESEKSRVEAEVRALEAERKTAQEERERLLVRREQLTAGVREDILAHYERLRRARHGVALAEVRDGLCNGCHVRLRPQAYNEIRASDVLLTCETCSRILYFVPQPEGAVVDAGTLSDSQPAIHS